MKTLLIAVFLLFGSNQLEQDNVRIIKSQEVQITTVGPGVIQVFIPKEILLKAVLEELDGLVVETPINVKIGLEYKKL